MTAESRDTIAERIRLHGDRLTRAEHKLVDALLANYPVAGLSSITEFAQAPASVDADGSAARQEARASPAFPPSRRHCAMKLTAQLQDPIARHRPLVRGCARRAHAQPLRRRRARQSAHLASSSLDHREFDRIADLLADRRRSHSHHRRPHHQAARRVSPHASAHGAGPAASLMPASPALWPQYLLNMDQDGRARRLRRPPLRSADSANLRQLAHRAAPRSSCSPISG